MIHVLCRCMCCSDDSCVVQMHVLFRWLMCCSDACVVQDSCVVQIRAWAVQMTHVLCRFMCCCTAACRASCAHHEITRRRNVRGKTVTRAKAQWGTGSTKYGDRLNTCFIWTKSAWCWRRQQDSYWKKNYIVYYIFYIINTCLKCTQSSRCWRRQKECSNLKSKRTGASVSSYSHPSASHSTEHRLIAWCNSEELDEGHRVESQEQSA
jgi:hypothetical protein